MERKFTKQELIDLGLSNGINDYLIKIKRRKILFTVLKYVTALIITIIMYNLKY